MTKVQNDVCVETGVSISPSFQKKIWIQFLKKIKLSDADLCMVSQFRYNFECLIQYRPRLLLEK